MNHAILITELKTHIRDNFAITIIKLQLKAGYVNIHNLIDKNIQSFKGTPQGSILSPLLANIYFNILDKWVETQLLPKYNNTRVDKVNEKYKYNQRFKNIEG